MDRISADLYVLSQTQDDFVRYAHLCAPRKILEATQFNQRYRRYEEIDNVPDRLRWCRHSKGLMQKDVAKNVGVSRNVYINIECGTTKQIPAEMSQKLTELYVIPIRDFLDEFNQFLYDGQANRIRKYREGTGLGKWKKSGKQKKLGEIL